MVNKVLLIGNLGGDPESKFTPNGKQYTSFSIATTEKYKDQGGNLQESTEWHRIITWNRLAEICAQYLKKGSRVYIEGKLRTRNWTDDKGVKHYATEIIAHEMKMLSARPADGDSQGQPSGNSGNFPEYPSEPEPYTGTDVPF